MERLMEELMSQASNAEERVCAADGYDTKLSKYNKAPLCSLHTTDPTRGPRP
jgi:hypothetical protein